MGRPEGICALCEESKLLCMSHIVPRFCNKAILNEDNQLVSINLNDQYKKSSFRQDEFKEYLLCEDCEQLLQSYEIVFKQDWFDSFLADITAYKVEENLCLLSLDYKTHKLFHLSIIWRFHVSKKYGRYVDLGPYAKKIRQKLIEGDPGPDIHFPIAGLLNLKDEEAVHIIAEPAAKKIDNATWYLMQYAGCDWFMIMTDHPSRDQKRWREGLSETGVMKVFFGDYKDGYTFKFLRKKIIKD